MATSSLPEPPSGPGWPMRQVYGIAATSLVLGLALGYFVFAKKSGVARPHSSTSSPGASQPGIHPRPTLDQMKQLANVQAATLIEKSKTDSKNPDLFRQIAQIYQSAHQFKEAAVYYDKSLQLDPKNVATRTEMASCLYYSGDADGALKQLELCLKEDPKNVNALFNAGMIKYKGKQDAAGAIAVWQKLLKTNPNLERKATVEQMIAEAKGSNNVESK